MLSIHLSMNENKAEGKKYSFLNRWTFDYDLKEMELLFLTKKMNSRYTLHTLNFKKIDPILLHIWKDAQMS